MGEKIKILSKGKLFNAEFEIELNHSIVSRQGQQVHLQSEKFRFEIDKKDYFKYALSILVAEKNLKTIKNIK